MHSSLNAVLCKLFVLTVSGTALIQRMVDTGIIVIAKHHFKCRLLNVYNNIMSAICNSM